MMASWPASKHVLLSDLENVGQGHHVKKSLHLIDVLADLPRLEQPRRGVDLVQFLIISLFSALKVQLGNIIVL